jgi:pyrroline-5-carboxylate reductase
MLETQPVIAFVGAGNMATSLIGGLIKQGFSADNIWASSPEKDHLYHLQKSFSVHITQDNRTAVQHADIVIFAVKPQVIKHVVTDLAATINQKKPLLISIVAGTTVLQMNEWLQESHAIIRVMPNTPALLGVGASALYANEHTRSEQRKNAEEIFSSVGLTVFLENEPLIDVVAALSGSGPAYFFYMMDALVKKAVDLGLEEAIARKLIAQTALGSAEMILQNSSSLNQLQKNVTSPGGGTEQAVKVFEQRKLDEILQAGLQAAHQRYLELSKL